ncbi:MAG: hypothetical protein C0478_12640 [Planctomyces sp.]|nr:hypothetical protein [Planctomyces sp.]
MNKLRIIGDPHESPSLACYDSHSTIRTALLYELPTIPRSLDSLSEKSRSTEVISSQWCVLKEIFTHTTVGISEGHRVLTNHSCQCDSAGMLKPR